VIRLTQDSDGFLTMNYMTHWRSRDLLKAWNENNIGQIELMKHFRDKISDMLGVPIKLGSYIPKVSYLLIKLYMKRMFHKYLVREFHPLIFFYLFSFFNLVLVCPPLIGRLFSLRIINGYFPQTTLILLSFSFMIGFLSLFFGMWLDMEDNKRLRERVTD